VAEPVAVIRFLTGIIGLALTAFALLIARTQLRGGFDPMGAIFGLGAATAALFCWWFAIRGKRSESRARMRFVLLSGLVVGAIGFVAGFFGPILLWPDANQGPLLGIFVTGPLGFALGALAGWLYLRLRSWGGVPEGG